MPEGTFDELDKQDEAQLVGEAATEEVQDPEAGALPDARGSLSVKALESDDSGVIVGGYLLLWGNEQRRDVQEEFFTKSSELWLDQYPVVPVLFHHGLDRDVDLAVVGRRVEAKADDMGVFVKHWIDKSNKYWAWIQPLLEAERLYYSPGSAPHLVRSDKKTGEIFTYPIIEDTLTPIPAQPRLRPIQHIKAAYKSANLEAPDLGGGESADSRLEVERAKAEALRLAMQIELDKLA